jgi:hypothetical protein
MKPNKPRSLRSRVRVGPSFRKITNSLFDCNIDILASFYQKIANDYLVTNGPRWTCKRLKDYYDLATRVTLDLDVIVIPFCISDSSGIPKDLKTFIPFLKSKNINRRRACLTLLKSYVQIYDEVSKDTTTITDQSTGEDLSDFMPYFDKVIDRYKYFLKPYISDESMHKSSKKGPNGLALLNLDKDFFAIRDNGILETVKEFHSEMTKISTGKAKQEVSLKQDLYPELDLIVFESDRLIEDRLNRKLNMMKHVETMMKHAIKYEPNRYNNCEHSKIGFIAEGGCKTRVIAIGDYFTQDALKPLHKSLYRCLNKLKTDGTSSHNRISQLVKSKTKSSTYVGSFDLTAATDRFPISLQERVICGLYNQNVSSLWRKLMVDRDFTVDSNKKVRYSVGQPMGFLSSWASFALTHHILIEALAMKCGYPRFRDYCIIGDDVTIFDEKVSKEYQSFLNRIKVSISVAKSLESRKQPCSAEIAKRLFLNGQEISPIPYDAIESAIKDYLLFPNLLKLCNERDIISNDVPQPVQDALKDIYSKGKLSDKVMQLISFPYSVPQFRVRSDIWSESKLTEIKSIFDNIRLDYIKSRAKGLYTNELMSIPDMGTLGLVLESEENPDISRHPFMSLLREYRGVCGSIYIGIATKGIQTEDLDKIPYLVNPLIPSYIRRSHQIERVRSSLILKTYKILIDQSVES